MAERPSQGPPGGFRRGPPGAYGSPMYPSQPAGTNQSAVASQPQSSADVGLFDNLPWWSGPVAAVLAVAALAVAGYILITSEDEGDQATSKGTAKQGKDPPKRTEASAQDIFDLCLAEAHKAQKRGDYVKAEKYYEKVVTHVEKEFGSASPQSVTLYFLMSLMYGDKGDLAAQEEVLLKAVAQVRKLAKKDLNESACVVLATLSDVYHDQKRLDEAKKICEEAMEVSIKVHGEKHKNVGFCAGQLATIEWGLNNPTKAEEWYKKSVELMKLDSTVDEFVVYYKNIKSFVEMLLQIGRGEDAIQVILSEMEHCKNSNKPAVVSISTMLFKQELALVYYKQDALDKAFDEYEAVVLGQGARGNIQLMRRIKSVSLCYLINIAFQLGKVDELKRYEHALKTAKGLQFFPITESKYLTTNLAKLSPDEFCIKLTVVEWNHARRLQTGNYLECSFDNPDVDGEPYVTTLVLLKEHIDEKIVLSWPDFNKDVKLNDWLAIQIIVWEDDTKTKKLGTHRQLVRMDSKEKQAMYEQG